MSSSTPVRNPDFPSNLFQKELGTPPKFKLKKPKESWEQIIRKAVTLRPKATLTFHVREIYGRVIESFPYFRTENPESVLQNISEALRNSDCFKSLGDNDSWTLEETSEDTSPQGGIPKPSQPGMDLDQHTFKMPTAYPFSPIRETTPNARPLMPSNRQILPAGDPFGPPKLAPLLPSSPTPSPQNARRTPRKLREHTIKILPSVASSGFSPIRSQSGITDVFMNDRHDSDTEDEDWKSLGPNRLSLKKKIPRFPLEQLVPLTPSKRVNAGTDSSNFSLPPTPVTPSTPRTWNRPVDILPNTTPKAAPPDDDEDTDDENWAQMDLTPKRKPANSSLESHTPMKKALEDIGNVEEQMPNDKKIALEALALLCCSPNRGTITADTSRHGDARPTAISL
ncbi:hypothetical protein K493DRAFT_314370 [Basidiobolus meristosporus CBS 931.73]|uniref:Fork-head domain-containing protein n=1 Tax=Basidiobolus meristosporus CBS 931.73 TaxID=1314790 RepID=A0A1Y1YFE6_9FUNG|nr:hypothetical protein K493DRAFT_314370 [Basidiobolus meristosporus CBS 931.73]|eukprot:ORX96732.1 hypothetical protein K493DRAFT_314370 [Basidiobolus meristosporus CBS 931.73]